MPSAIVEIPVKQFIGRSLCILLSDAQRLYDRVLGCLNDGRPVNLCFDGIEVVISAFLNIAIGQLYGQEKLTYERVDALLKWSGLDDYDDELVQAVIENAKLYYSRSKSQPPVWEGDLDEEEE